MDKSVEILSYENTDLRFVIHTVFILKENILFLEEWINYHILLGFNWFYLYDNSKVNKISGFDAQEFGQEEGGKYIVYNKINKHNVNYDKIVNMTQKDMDDYVKKLCEKYKCIDIIEWSPKDKEGNILYNQAEAHNHCLKRLKKDNIDWCAYIDMDEYIVIKDYDNISQYIESLSSEIKNVKLGQIRFESRFHNLDKLVTEITLSENENYDRNHSNKNIFNVKDTISTDIHEVVLKNQENEYLPPLNEIWFNHYKLDKKNTCSYNKLNETKDINNIKIKINKESFIPLK
tara:strand:+ start:1944 stop:2810 length:867 start_codon:yes stop_codon:yes gene_type:complete